VIDIINTRIAHDHVVALDDLVRRGRYTSRTDAVRTAIAVLLTTEREADIVESHRRAYGSGETIEDDAVVARTSKRIYRHMIEADMIEADMIEADR
jgi:Arc/MetJ-type ribon-helix-helix transcriptional regulator